MKTLWRIYNKHVKTPDAHAQLEELVSIIKSGRSVCLLCFERDPAHCHRSRIAELVAEAIGVKVEDLAAPLF